MPHYTTDENALSEAGIAELYSQNTVAKILRTASQGLKQNDPPTFYPEVVPQSGESMGIYKSRSIDFWTSGFFPGSIYSLLERAIKFPRSIETNDSVTLTKIQEQLKQLGLRWSEPLHPQALRTDTHDLGFVIMPHMRPRWELFHDRTALNAIITAAESLYSRYDPAVGAVRSWDDLDWLADMLITSKDNDFLVIIDSMCNMELLLYASAQSGNTRYAEAAQQHARTLLKSHLRTETCVRGGYAGKLYSTFHLVNFYPDTGAVKEKNTAQGYHKTSTWSRGQSWGILGYAQVYQYCRQPEFLDAACGLAEYFMLRLETASGCVQGSGEGVKGGETQGRFVPQWDFDAPIDATEGLIRDSSAGVVAANGMLLLSQILIGEGNVTLATRYREAAMLIVKDTLRVSLATEKVTMTSGEDKESIEVNDCEAGRSFEAILKNATVCNNPASIGKNRTWDQGLVYGDYYLIEFGNNLLRYGLA